MDDLRGDNAEKNNAIRGLIETEARLRGEIREHESNLNSLHDGNRHLRGQISSYASDLNVKDAVIDAKINEIEDLRKRVHGLEERIDVELQSLTADANQKNWVMDQYKKVQDYVLKNQLYKGWHDDNTHADILAGEHNFQTEYSKNAVERAQAAENELRAIKMKIMWADEISASLDTLVDQIERMGIKL